MFPPQGTNPPEEVSRERRSQQNARPGGLGGSQRNREPVIRKKPPAFNENLRVAAQENPRSFVAKPNLLERTHICLISTVVITVKM
ncbi:hypothetical protein CDAR_44881 [Caerostris darwini]|uniref:Uncharacterized protein n=1 Tax=Caerostris darwini TaxID=1538125 RepID=A0AAV4WSU5_9ARAC|nr:hypothetical protein CDAR_44881 [Caerostris darwini]